MSETNDKCHICISVLSLFLHVLHVKREMSYLKNTLMDFCLSADDKLDILDA